MQLVYLRLGFKPHEFIAHYNLIICCLKGARNTDLQLHYRYLKLFFIVVIRTQEFLCNGLHFRREVGWWVV